MSIARTLRPRLTSSVAGRSARRQTGIWLVAVTFGALTMISSGALLVWNVWPWGFSPGAHAVLGSTPLALIALALLTYQVARRPPPLELVRAILLAAAFLCWSANQLLPDIAESVLLNDIAIVLFVLDVFLMIVSSPPATSSLRAGIRDGGHPQAIDGIEDSQSASMP